MNQLARTPLFWIVASICAVGATVFSIRYFSSAIPLVHINITANRSDVYAQARTLAQQNSIGPVEYYQAASFDTDHNAQTFIELEGGGKPAFIAMLEKHLYEPYTWHVRHMQENNVHEATFMFTPEGVPYGFKESISENDPGAALSPEEAQKIAEQAAPQWNINLAEYTLVEPSNLVLPSGRIDHSFVYERKDERITSEGTYRVRISVRGDRIGQVEHFVKIPESFHRRYDEMRSANHSISWAAYLLYTILYLIGGVCIGLFVFQKKRYIIWKPAIIIGFILALLMTLSHLNRFPHLFMHYYTALSMTTYIMSLLMGALYIFIFNFFYITLVIAAAEALTRKAFGNQASMWQWWKTQTASSYTIFGQTVGGYLMMLIHFGYAIGFYSIVAHLKGWWMPLESMYDPNIIANYIPCLGPLSTALYAGLIEECLFRAVPLAGAALLGARWGKRNLFITIAFVLQVIIFGAAHASYPMQPAYARLIELIIPSCIFGGLYLYFGLLVGIISHILYDVVWMALPIFINTGLNAQINQVAVIVCSLIPLLIVLYAYFKKGLHELATTAYNYAWQPTPLPFDTTSTYPAEPIIIEQTKSARTVGYIVAALSGITLIWLLTEFKFQKLIPRMTVSRSQAQTIAREQLQRLNIVLDESWKTLVTAYTTYHHHPVAHRFIWQTGGADLYKKLMAAYYLESPYWHVRFATFEDDIVKRAEEYHIYIDDKGTVFRIQHLLPESTVDESLSEQDARVIAHGVLTDQYHLDPQTLTEISASAHQLPNRKDWTFTFANPLIYPLSTGQARIDIDIAGGKITDFHCYIHVPEEWERTHENKEAQAHTVYRFCILLFIALLVLAFISACGSLSTLIFPFRLFAVILIVRAVATINSWPTHFAVFSTSEPLLTQYLQHIGNLIFQSFLATIGISYLVWATTRIKRVSAYPFDIRGGGGLPRISMAPALFLSAISILCLFLSQYKEPLWGDYTELGSWFPFLSIIYSYLFSFTAMTGYFMLFVGLVQRFTNYGTTRHIHALLFCIVMGFIAAGMEISDIAWWPILGIAYSLGIMAVYHVTKKDITLIPPIIAFYCCLFVAVVQMILCKAFAYSVPLIIALALGLYAGQYWYKKLHGK
jgi:hypothetical protein